MEATLLYFGLGIAVFAVERLMQIRNKKLGLLTYLEIGFLMGCSLGLFTGVPLTPYVHYPWLAMGFLGLIAGFLIYLAQKGEWLSRPGFQYIAAIILGSIHSVMCYGFMHLYVMVFKNSSLYGDPVISLCNFLLIGYIMIFGYTFPKRFFILQSDKEKSENT